ncbi:MAG: ANTAR domain-containing protein [Nitriliruptorales bacterium]|nr:ANTAR domain-containing protein [Nitriliruptorales bacterium]
MRNSTQHPPDLAAVLAEFAQLMVDDRTPKQILERLGQYSTELLPVDGIGVLLRTPEGGLEAVSANTEAGAVVEKAEAELAEGPCTDAMVMGEQIAVRDLEQARDRWPRFVPRALDSGIRAIHALPLTARGERLGSVDLVATAVLDLTAAQLATAQLLADVTVAYLVSTRAFEEKSTLARQLQGALDSRIIIEQAKGKLSERRGTTITEAFELLRRHARSNGIKLHDVAGAVVRGDLQL